MSDALIEQSKDPSCILALFPENRCSQLAALRIPTPRNFRTSPKEWSDFKTAASNTGSRDFHFEIAYEQHGDTEEDHNIFHTGSWQEGSLQISGSTAAVCMNVAGTPTRIAEVAINSVSGKISIEISRSGNIFSLIAVLPDGTRQEESATVADALFIANKVPVSGFGGVIDHITFTCGETVWKAPYNALHDMTGLHVSDTLRNFVDTLTLWDDLAMKLKEIASDDMEFEYQYYLSGEQIGKQIMHGVPFNGYLSMAGTSIAFTASFINGELPYNEAPVFNQWRTMKYVRSRGNAYLYVNGNSVVSRTGITNVDLSALAISLKSNHNGYLRGGSLKNLTTGRTLWFYPATPERQGLCEFTNIRTDRNLFEAVNETQLAKIATQLDFRGNSTSKTFIVRAFCPKHETGRFIHPLIGQGKVADSVAKWVFQMSLWEDYRTGYKPTFKCGVTSAGNSSTYSNANVENIEWVFDTWHTFAFVADYGTGSDARLRSYIDGVLQKDCSAAAAPWGSGDGSAAAGIREDTAIDSAKGGTRIAYAFIFDRALSTAEIAALAPRYLSNNQ